MLFISYIVCTLVLSFQICVKTTILAGFRLYLLIILTVVFMDAIHAIDRLQYFRLTFKITYSLQFNYYSIIKLIFTTLKSYYTLKYYILYIVNSSFLGYVVFSIISFCIILCSSIYTLFNKSVCYIYQNHFKRCQCL